MNGREAPSSPVAIATACSAVVTAQFIAGKATRDALYLLHLDVTTLPAMTVVTAVVSILLVVASSKLLRRVAPARFVPLTFVTTAALLLVDWALIRTRPEIAAVGLYLQISGLGPMLGSGFWLIATERFDPRTAKRNFGRIAAGGTLGGLAGGVLGERVAATLDMTTMLPILAALNLAAAWLVWVLATGGTPRRNVQVEIAPELSSEAPTSGLRALTAARYLRNLAALVLLGSAAASLMDYVFKAEAVAAFGAGDGLLRFFAIYYAGVSVITFLIQAGLNSVVMERLGLAVSAGTPSLALAAGGAVAAAVPGVASVTFARGAESACRGSLFRSSYEVFFTPVPPKEKRAAKSLIDVGCDRLGDALGAGVIRGALVLMPTYRNGPLVLLSIGCSAVALLFATRLHRGYIQTLERSLLNRAVELDLSDVEDTTTRTVMLQTLPAIRARAAERTADTPATAARRPPVEKAVPTITAMAQDPELRDIAALRSRDRDKILQVLQSQKLTPMLVPHVIPLLAWDAVAAPALDALRRIADERTGELIDALLDPNQDFAVRRRLARVFASCTTQRAADGVALGLNDHRFEVRFQCARSLVTIVDRHKTLRVDRDFIFEVIQRETAVGRPVWESHRLLNQRDDRDEKFFVDDFVKDRADRSLAHVFTLLSLVLPAEPLRIAFRGLHTDDPALRGTALEYLEGILPPTLRERLWPFLEDRRTSTKTARPRDEILADLLRSHASIVLNLEELQRRGPTPKEKPWPTR